MFPHHCYCDNYDADDDFNMHTWIGEGNIGFICLFLGKANMQQTKNYWNWFFFFNTENRPVCYSALIWQKEASDKSDISRKRAKCVRHLHWRQWNIMMSYLTYLLVGWLFLHEIWPGRRAHYVNYENINNSNLDGMSLASFCQSRAVFIYRAFSQ